MVFDFDIKPEKNITNSPDYLNLFSEHFVLISLSPTFIQPETLCLTPSNFSIYGFLNSSSLKNTDSNGFC